MEIGIWDLIYQKKFQVIILFDRCSKVFKVLFKGLSCVCMEHPNGILVTGYPKDKYTKFNLTYTVKEIEQFPMLLIGMFLVNAIVTF